RGGQPGEKRPSQLLAHLLRRADPDIERIPEKREPDAEHDPDEKRKDAVPDWLGLRLSRLVGLPNNRERRRLQRLQGLELLLLLDQVRVEGRGVVALRLEIADP